MPPSARKPAEKEPGKNGEICRQCWPDGWPGRDTAASCENGNWHRDAPAAD